MKIEIYGTKTCPFCNNAKAAVKHANLTYTDYIVGENATKQDIQDRVNALGIQIEIKTVPQIFIDDQYVGGYTELLKLYDWARDYNRQRLAATKS